LLDTPCDAYAVVWLEQERTQDQQVERPLQ
jgi:hypothetical protein